MKPKINIADLASKLLELSNQNKNLVKLPPVLKNKNSLMAVIKFFISYYAKDSDLTLKNANVLPFKKISASKMHIWMQNIASSIRITLLHDTSLEEQQRIQKAYEFFSECVPKCPLALKSVIKPYKFITIDNWTKEQFFYCCNREMQDIPHGLSTSYVLEQFYSEGKNIGILDAISNLITISDSLEFEGKYDLSEKLLHSTERISAQLGYINE